MRPALFRRLMNLWPPFVVGGIAVTRLSDDWTHADIRMKLRLWNRNYVGTHFGGNLFAMTDPFWMLLAINQLGPDYVVWDKAGEIEFVAPGRGTVHARFHLPQEVTAEMREAARGGAKVLRWFPVDVVAEDGSTVARVRKQLYVRRKRTTPHDSSLETR